MISFSGYREVAILYQICAMGYALNESIQTDDMAPVARLHGFENRFRLDRASSMDR